MKLRKSGISLIVLVITIVVMIILTLVIILSVSESNPIEKSNETSFKSDLAALQDDLHTYILRKVSQNPGAYDENTLNADKDTLYENNEAVGQKTIKDVLPSIKDKYVDKVEIQNGKLQYVDTNNMQDYSWALNVLEKKEGNYAKEQNDNSRLLKLDSAKEKELDNLKIYGNSVQNNSNTSNLESVGDIKYNLFNMMEAVDGKSILKNNDETLTVKTYGTPAGTLKNLAPTLKVGDKVTFSMKTTGYDALVIGSAGNQRYIPNKGTFEVTQELLDGVVWFYSKPSGAGDAVISAIQLEYGEKATEYMSYDEKNLGKYKIPVIISEKNLFDISKITTFKAWNYSTTYATYSSISDGVITSKIGRYASGVLLYDSKITLSSGTYTISAEFMADKDTGNKGIGIGIKNFSTDKSNLKDYTLSSYRKWEKVSHTFTLNEETDIAVITQGTGQKDDYMNLNIKIKNIQLEVGDKATEYKEYTKIVYDIYLDEPLRKLDGAVDYVDLKSKKVVRNVKEENGALSKLNTPKIYSINLPDIITKSGTNILTVGTNVSPSKIEAIYNTEK